MLNLLTKPLGALLAPGQNKPSENAPNNNAQNGNAKKDRVESSGDRFDFSQAVTSAANQPATPKPAEVVESVAAVIAAPAQPVVEAVAAPARPVTQAPQQAEQPAKQIDRAAIQPDEAPADLNAEERARAHALKAMAQERLLNLVAQVTPTAKEDAQAAPSAAKVELRA